MKMIVAYIRPVKQDEVVNRLRQMEVPGASMHPVDGFGLEADPSGQESYGPQVTPYAEMVRVEVVCSDGRVEDWTQTIADAAQTGRRGDGKVFVLPVTNAVDIRTLQTGDTVV